MPWHIVFIEANMFGFKPYPGYFYTGDGAVRDKDGYIWIKGRVDGMYIPTPFLYVL